MKEFLINNWATILLVVAVFFYVFYLAWNKRWDELRKFAYTLILQAEKNIAGSKRGQERFNLVLGQLYNLIPGWLKFFISEKSMREKLQSWFDEVKDYLDDGKLNKSTQQPKPPDTILKRI